MLSMLCISRYGFGSLLCSLHVQAVADDCKSCLLSAHLWLGATGPHEPLKPDCCIESTKAPSQDANAGWPCLTHSCTQQVA